MNMKRILISFTALLLVAKTGFTQNVGIGTSTPDPSALLHVNSTSKGLLLPRLTNAQMNDIITPARGLMVFNLDEGKFYYYNGTIWTGLTDSNDNGRNLLEVTGNDSLTTHSMLVGDTTAHWTLYSGTGIEQTKKFNNTSGLAGAPLQSIRTEKYGADYSPNGRMGEWNRYISRNWYNSNERPGEILTRDSYNTNSGGGALFAGEGAWSHVLESDWNRVFEDYVQVSLSTGYSYRPFAMYISKDLAENDITFRGHIFHINPVGVTQDYLNVKNGKLVLSKVSGAPSEVSNTLFSMVNGVREINLINNTQSLVFAGGHPMLLITILIRSIRIFLIWEPIPLAGKKYIQIQWLFRIQPLMMMIIPFCQLTIR